jgi:CBS domain-containing protein
MLLRDLPVRDVMVTEVVAFRPDDNVQDAMRAMVRRDVDGAPVLDADGRVVGMLSTGDLIVEEARIPLPAVITLLGGIFELPGSRRRYEDTLEKALGSTVGEVMQHELAATLDPDDTLETAATVMHDHDLDRVPVVDADRRLVGLLARGDIVRAIIDEADRVEAGAGAPAELAEDVQ